MFIPRRFIADNIIVAYEELHFTKTMKKKSKMGNITLKLDISKAMIELNKILSNESC